MLRVDRDQLRSAKRQVLCRCGSRKIKRYADSSPSIHVDLTISELGLVGANGQERLYWIVCDDADLRIHSITAKLCPKCQYPRMIDMLPIHTSSRANSCPERPSDKSFWMPTCFPLKRWAISTETLAMKKSNSNQIEPNSRHISSPRRHGQEAGDAEMEELNEGRSWKDGKDINKHRLNPATFSWHYCIVIYHHEVNHADLRNAIVYICKYWS